MTKYYYVYILASQKNGTLYVGITSDLIKRVWQHKNKIFKGFTEKYQVNKLVYYNVFENVSEAISYEKILKGWNRKWKLQLIEKENYNWIDLYDRLLK